MIPPPDKSDVNVLKSKLILNPPSEDSASKDSVDFHKLSNILKDALVESPDSAEMADNTINTATKIAWVRTPPIVAPIKWKAPTANPNTLPHKWGSPAVPSYKWVAPAANPTTLPHKWGSPALPPYKWEAPSKNPDTQPHKWGSPALPPYAWQKPPTNPTIPPVVIPTNPAAPPINEPTAPGGSTPVELPPANPSPPPPFLPPPVTSQPASPDVVGTGSGPLILDGLTDKKLTIKPGVYTYFEFKNFKNVTIDGAHNVKVVGGAVNLSNMSGVILTNFDVLNSQYRAFDIYGVAKDLILSNLNISNIADVCMVFHANEIYNGQSSSYSQNIQLLNIVADNVSTFFAGTGSVTDNGFTGLIRNFKMSNCTIKNSPRLADGVFLGCAEDYEFSNNKIDNVNSMQGNHNGIFHVVGNGKVFNNTCTNHQGNMIRAWMCSITKPGTVEIYNNVVWNSTRYGAFELQVPPFLKALRGFNPGATAKVYNNTVGQLNTGLPKYFEGRLLDLYDIYTSVEVYNNLLFNDRDEMILNNMSSAGLTTVIKNSNNVYKANASDAVSDLTNFRSLVPGVGASR